MDCAIDVKELKLEPLDSDEVKQEPVDIEEMNSEMDSEDAAGVAQPAQSPPHAVKAEPLHSEDEDDPGDAMTSQAAPKQRPRSKQCPVCEKECASAGALKNHLRVHTGEKPYACPLCPATFSLKGSLKQHHLVHTGQQRFQCVVCHRKFSLNENLTRHIRRVHAEPNKPHQCEHCSAKFCTRFELKQHLVTHTGQRDYQCTECGKKFGQAGHLRQHLLTHTGEKQHECDVCGKRFGHKQHLNTHLRVQCK